LRYNFIHTFFQWKGDIHYLSEDSEGPHLPGSQNFAIVVVLHAVCRSFSVDEAEKAYTLFKQHILPGIVGMSETTKIAKITSHLDERWEGELFTLRSLVDGGRREADIVSSITTSDHVERLWETVDEICCQNKVLKSIWYFVQKKFNLKDRGERLSSSLTNMIDLRYSERADDRFALEMAQKSIAVIASVLQSSEVQHGEERHDEFENAKVAHCKYEATIHFPGDGNSSAADSEHSKPQHVVQARGGGNLRVFVPSTATSSSSAAAAVLQQTSGGGVGIVLLPQAGFVQQPSSSSNADNETTSSVLEVATKTASARADAGARIELLRRAALLVEGGSAVVLGDASSSPDQPASAGHIFSALAAHDAALARSSRTLSSRQNLRALQSHIIVWRKGVRPISNNVYAVRHDTAPFRALTWSFRTSTSDRRYWGKLAEASVQPIIALFDKSRFSDEQRKQLKEHESLCLFSTSCPHDKYCSCHDNLWRGHNLQLCPELGAIELFLHCGKDVEKASLEAERRITKYIRASPKFRDLLVNSHTAVAMPVLLAHVLHRCKHPPSRVEIKDAAAAYGAEMKEQIEQRRLRGRRCGTSKVKKKARHSYRTYRSGNQHAAAMSSGGGTSKRRRRASRKTTPFERLGKKESQNTSKATPFPWYATGQTNLGIQTGPSPTPPPKPAFYPTSCTTSSTPVEVRPLHKVGCTCNECNEVLGQLLKTTGS